MDFYKKYSKQFINDTIDNDMSFQYEFFLKYLSNEANTILDLGFGSGRDSLYFSKKYNVYSIDPEESFCDHAKKLGLKNVYCMKVENMDFVNIFDGIWACSSLLHIKYENLLYAFNKCYNALKENGIMYASFKYGDFEGDRNGRYFTDLNEKRLENIIEATSFEIIEICITEDVRPNITGKWLNFILKKK